MSNDKKLYKIGYLTKTLGITSRTIRYYDQFGLLPHVKRSEGNVRLFDDEDLELIKKIRSLQKEEYLPLDVIKERLFQSDSKENKQVIAVITDSLATLPKEVCDQSILAVAPFQIQLGTKVIQDRDSAFSFEKLEKLRKANQSCGIVEPSIAAYVDAINAFVGKGFKNIYIFTSSSTYSASFSNAQKATYQISEKINIVVIDTHMIGGGQGLFVQMIMDAINQGNTAKQVDLLISKQLPLIYSMFYLDSMKNLISSELLKDTEKSSLEVMHKLFAFKPILAFDSKRQSMDVLACYKDRAEALEKIYACLEEEKENRRNYLNKICVFYRFLYSEAVEVANQLKHRFPNTDVVLAECNPSISLFFGNEFIGVSII